MMQHPQHRRFPSDSSSEVPALLSASVSSHTLDSSQCSSQGSARQPDLLTVFQASPLVYEDALTGDLIPLEFLDFQQERHILETALRDAHMDIDLAFDIATSARLGAFLAKREGRVLHFSCHGHEKFLAIENGLGKMQALEVPNLKRWISAGGHHLQFVFVSACHSRKAGEAFVEAGVPHVVCCRHDDAMLRDAAAIEFSKAFYTALACGTPLDRAFKLGQQQVENSPEIPASVRQTEVSKFVLLPEGEDHHVQIFNAQGMWRSPRCLTTSSNTDMALSQQIPYPPDIFEGRQVDVHKLLVALRSARLVKIAGPQGVGKVSVVQAACHYMRERPHGFPSQILWLPSDDIECDELTKLFSSIFNVLESEPESSLNRLDNDSWYTQCRRNILKAVGNRRFVLVLEVRRLSGCEARFHKIAEMLNYLIRNTQHVRAIVIHDVAELGVRSSGCEKDLVVAPLDFESTVCLFGRLCQHVANQRCRDVGNFRDLGHLLLPSEGPVDTPRSSRCREIFKMIGEGIPRRIHDKAKRMSGEDYDKLISLGRRMEQKLQFSTRAAFDKRYEELTTEMNHHVETRQFLKAQECKELLDEMDVLSEDLPDLDTLKSMRDHTELDLDRAIQLREFLSADQMQDQLQALIEKIQAEKDARRELGIDPSGSDDDSGDDEEDGDVKQKRTRAEICSIIDALEKQLDAANDENDFTECRRLDAELGKLIRERDALPSTEMLLLKVSDLEHNLKVAKTQRNWDEAQRVHDRLQQAQERLRVERQAETDFGLKTRGRRPSEAIQPGAVAVSPVAVAPAVALSRPAIAPGVSKDAISASKATTETRAGSVAALGAAPPALLSPGAVAVGDESIPPEQQKSAAAVARREDSGNLLSEEASDGLAGLPVAKPYQPEKAKRRKPSSRRPPSLSRSGSSFSDEEQRVVNSVSFTSPTSSRTSRIRRESASVPPDLISAPSDSGPEGLREEFRRSREVAISTTEESRSMREERQIIGPSRCTDSVDDGRPNLERASSVGTFSVDDKTESSVLVIDDASVFSSSADGSASLAGQFSQMSQDDESTKKAEDEAILAAAVVASRNALRPLPPPSAVPRTATVQHVTSTAPTVLAASSSAGSPERGVSAALEPPLETNGSVIDKSGRVITAEEQARVARRKGVCVHCGVRTHDVKPFSRTPLTNDEAYNGYCIQHSRTMVPPVVFHAWERRNSTTVPPSVVPLAQARHRRGIHPPATQVYAPRVESPRTANAATDSDTVVTANSTRASSTFAEWGDAFLTVAAAGGSTSNLGPTSAPYPPVPAPQANAFVSPYSHNEILLGQMDHLNSRTHLLDELVNAEIERRTVPATKVEPVRSPKEVKAVKGFRLPFFGKKK